MTPLEKMFDHSLRASSGVKELSDARLARSVGLGTVSRGTTGIGAKPGLTVPEPFSGLLPRGLERGGVLGVDSDRYLAASLVGAAVRTGGSAALVGVGELGIEAVAAAGAPYSRLLVVRADASTWVKAVEVLIGAVDVVLVRPPSAVPDTVARRITARLHRGASVTTSLLVAGSFPLAPVRLRVAQARWNGLSAGHGLLESRRATVVAEGRGLGGQARAAEVYLPGPHGAVARIEKAAPLDELAARRALAAA